MAVLRSLLAPYVKSCKQLHCMYLGPILYPNFGLYVWTMMILGAALEPLGFKFLVQPLGALVVFHMSN